MFCPDTKSEVLVCGWTQSGYSRVNQTYTFMEKPLCKLVLTRANVWEEFLLSHDSVPQGDRVAY